MITRIEIDGFKTFQDFSVDLTPFQVIIGTNACGKSNLFDAIHLLSQLADHNLNTAFQNVRGDAEELFTILPDGRSVDKMRLAVEMLLEPTVRDEWGKLAELKHRRLRYEVDIERRSDAQGMGRIFVTNENLIVIPLDKDSWRVRLNGYIEYTPQPNIAGDDTWFIKTNVGAQVRFRFDDIDRKEKTDPYPSNIVGSSPTERTFLSSVNTTQYAHILATRQELRSWKLVRLDVEALRRPSKYLDEPYLAANGERLPATLARLQTENKYLLTDISRDMTNLVPGVAGIEIDKDEARGQYAIYARMRDARRISARLLSDGTLRMLALMTLRNDPQQRGVLCFEEPEDGVHPGALKRLVRYLRDMTTDLSDPEQAQQPLRQLLITTHAPALVSKLDLSKGELLFADMATRIQPGAAPMQITRMMPVLPDAEERTPEGSYSLTRVLEYLDSADIKAARENVRKAVLR